MSIDVDDSWPSHHAKAEERFARVAIRGVASRRLKMLPYPFAIGNARAEDHQSGNNSRLNGEYGAAWMKHQPPTSDDFLK
ncbi:MAG TPA: hypothetical protein VHZ55_29505 [Bryobacteraceae bacterium]|jgi:hypothetical protein|nr:hypothetical protein [Bryobacteraceae bacterium]